MPSALSMSTDGEALLPRSVQSSVLHREAIMPGLSGRRVPDNWKTKHFSLKLSASMIRVTKPMAICVCMQPLEGKALFAASTGWLD